MTQTQQPIPARCPGCAAVMSFDHGLLARLRERFMPRELSCRQCRMKTTSSAALTMGQMFAAVDDAFFNRLVEAIRPLRRLEPTEMAAIMGNDILQVRRLENPTTLLAYARDLVRPMLVQQAHGEHGVLDIATQKRTAADSAPIALGIMARSSVETAQEKKVDLFILRTPAGYLAWLANYPLAWVQSAARGQPVEAQADVEAGLMPD